MMFLIKVQMSKPLPVRQAGKCQRNAKWHEFFKLCALTLPLFDLNFEL